MNDNLVRRLRAETDGATVNPDGLEAADLIEQLEKQLLAATKQIKELEDEIENLEYEMCELENRDD